MNEERGHLDIRTHTAGSRRSLPMVQVLHTNRINDYKLITSHRLEHEVRAAIAEGWEPIGGPVYTGAYADGMQILIQAMVRRSV